MGPQEHAFRSGVDVIVATPGRLLDHFRYAVREARRARGTSCSTRPTGCSTWASCPDIRRILAHLPSERQTLFFSATMPPPIAALTREMLHDPVTINLAAPVGAGRRHHAGGLPGRAGAEVGAAARAAAHAATMQEALVFTRTKHRANRLAEYLDRRRGSPPSASTATARRRSGPRRSPGSRAGRYRVLVATDIAARGIDVEALGHVVNFDVPRVPDDYIHRVGRTARAEATGDAFTFVSPEEEPDLRAIETAVGKRLPRVTLPDFDYSARAERSRSRSRSASRPFASGVRPSGRARRAHDRRGARASSPGRGDRAARHDHPAPHPRQSRPEGTARRGRAGGGGPRGSGRPR